MPHLFPGARGRHLDRQLGRLHPPHTPPVGWDLEVTAEHSAASQIPPPTPKLLGSLQILHPAPHPQFSWSSMPRKEILETCAQVPMAAWLSSLCLEQEINLSADQGKGKGG